MTDFYSTLSRVYDIVFPENPAATDFLDGCIGHPGHMLDLACGTGIYAHSLSVRGHDVTGIDLDPDMIRLAEKHRSSSATRYIAGNMLDIGRLVPSGRFDLIYCIGNSLVHLGNSEEIARLATEVLALLDDNGVFVVQIVNFDRILRFNIDSLPPIERTGHGITLKRHYGISEDRRHVSFDTVLTVGGETFENSVRLLALSSGELTDILCAAGFGDMQLYGGYDGSAFTVDSPALIVKAVKQ